MLKQSKKVQKLILFFLIITLSLTTLTSCKKDETPSTTDEEPAANEETADETSEDDEAEGDEEPITLDFLMCWNGAANDFPEDMKNNPISQELAKKTGVILNLQTIVTNETEYLNTMFASGDIPDIVNAPYWNTLPGGEGGAIKKAAVEGLILELDPYIEKYPNIQRMMKEGPSEGYLKYDLEHPDYEGKHYVIPQQTPRTDDDVIHWAYNIRCREDILKELDIDPSSINDADSLYDLLKQIKNGDFKDISGKPVIPAGAWHDGWGYGDLLRPFGRNSLSGWRNFDDEGKHQKEGPAYELVSSTFDPMEEEKILFMRKLVSEGLIDPECFTHTDTVAKEKAAVGKVAVLGAHYFANRDFFKQTLYKTNPEMKYVPLGPIYNADGEVVSTNQTKGRSGSPGIFLSKDCKDPEKALEFIDYINSDEGLKLVTFGIEGVHHEMDGDTPKLTEEWQRIKEEDRKKYIDEGLGCFDHFIGSDPRRGWGWIDDAGEDADYAKEVEVNPMKFYDGISIDYIAREYPNRETYEDNTATLDYGKEFLRAIFADSDEEALKILEEHRQKLIDAGIEEFTEWMNQEVKKHEEQGEKLLY